MHHTHKAIGILGGTFDPIHFGHLRMALELREQLNLSAVHVIPCFQPVHRETPIASPEQRFNMVQCAVKDEPSLIADDREIKRQTPSYMVDTLLSLRADMPHTPLCLLLGIDAFLGLPQWHRFEEILELAHVIVAHRPNYALPDAGIIADLLATRLQKDAAVIHEQQNGNILLCTITALEISATEIRKLIAAHRNPKYLLPESVNHYIHQNNIYTV